MILLRVQVLSTVQCTLCVGFDLRGQEGNYSSFRFHLQTLTLSRGKGEIILTRGSTLGVRKLSIWLPVMSCWVPFLFLRQSVAKFMG